MSWINLATLLVSLRRRGIDPRDVTVYWDGKIDNIFRRPPPRHSELVPESETEEDQYFDDEEE